MKKKIQSIMLLIVVSIMLMSCGSADNVAGKKKDDLSDVVVFEQKRYDMFQYVPAPYDDIKNLTGIYTNTNEYDLENDKRYFTSLSIANDRMDDGSGNWIQQTYWCSEVELENWNPKYKLLDDGIDDFIQYCQKNNIPYLLETKKLSEEEIKELESEKMFAIATILLCISPDDFFQYELLPQLSYTISIVDRNVDEQWDNFVNNHN